MALRSAAHARSIAELSGSPNDGHDARFGHGLNPGVWECKEPAGNVGDHARPVQMGLRDLQPARRFSGRSLFETLDDLREPLRLVSHHLVDWPSQLVSRTPLGSIPHGGQRSLLYSGRLGTDRR